MWLLQCCGGVCWFITISGLNMLNRVLNSCSRRNMLNRLLQCYKVFASLLPTLGGTGLLQCCVCCVQVDIGLTVLNRVITMLCVLCAGQHWIDGAEQGYYNVVCVVCSVVCVGWIMLNRVITVLCVLCAGYHQQWAEHAEWDCYNVVCRFISNSKRNRDVTRCVCHCLSQQWLEHAEQSCYNDVCRFITNSGWNMLNRVVTNNVCRFITNSGWSMLNMVVTMLCVVCRFITSSWWSMLNMVVTMLCVVCRFITNSGWSMLNRVVTMLRVVCRFITNSGWSMLDRVVTMLCVVWRFITSSGWSMLNRVVTMLCVVWRFITSSGWSMLNRVVTMLCVVWRFITNSGWSMLNKVVTVLCEGLSPAVGGACWTRWLQCCVKVYHQQWVEHAEQGGYNVMCCVQVYHQQWVEHAEQVAAGGQRHRQYSIYPRAAQSLPESSCVRWGPQEGQHSALHQGPHQTRQRRWVVRVKMECQLALVNKSLAFFSILSVSSWTSQLRKGSGLKSMWGVLTVSVWAILLWQMC